MSKSKAPKQAGSAHCRPAASVTDGAVNTKTASINARQGPLQISSVAADTKATGRSATRYAGWLAGLALCGIVLVAYCNSFDVPLILDSKGLVLQDPRIRQATMENLALIMNRTYWWPLGESGLYRPATKFSYMLNYAVFGNGEQPLGYHCANLALHLGNVLLVFAVGRKLLGRLWTAALLAALWAVHPASTESVTNVAGRPDLLAAMAVLGAFLMYLRSTETAGFRRSAWLLGMSAATLAGVFSKESAVMIIAVIVLYEWGRASRRFSDLLCGILATGLPIAVMLLKRASVLAGSFAAEFPFTDNPITQAGFWAGRLTALQVLGEVIFQAVFPWHLSVDYSFDQLPIASGVAAVWIVLGAILAGAALVLVHRWNRAAFFFMGFALFFLLPTSNLLFSTGSIRADRFLYLPTFGILGCLVIAADAASARMRSPLIVPVAILLIIAGFAFRTWSRNSEWRDPFTLANSDVRTCPRSHKLHRLIADLELESPHPDLNRATQEIEISLAILSGLPDQQNTAEPYFIGGEAYLLRGDRLRERADGGASASYARAHDLLEQCLRINFVREQRQNRLASRTPEAYRLLSIAYERLGNSDAALRTAYEGHRLAPGNADFYHQTAALLLEREQGEEAAVTLLQGMLVTSDLKLRSDLLQLYASSKDPANCTLLPGPNGPSINTKCGIVRDHVCAAAPGALLALVQIGRRQDAAMQAKTLHDEFGCAAGPLAEALR